MKIFENVFPPEKNPGYAHGIGLLGLTGKCTRNFPFGGNGHDFAIVGLLFFIAQWKENVKFYLLTFLQISADFTGKFQELS